MAVAPNFIGVPRVGIGTVSAANTNRDGTGTIVDLLTAGSAGTRVNEIVVKATADPADSTLVLYLYDGAAYRVFDEIDLGDPAAGSTTVASYRTSQTYANLVIPSGYKVAASVTVAPTAGTLQVHVLGGDL